MTVLFDSVARFNRNGVNYFWDISTHLVHSLLHCAQRHRPIIVQNRRHVTAPNDNGRPGGSLCFLHHSVLYDKGHKLLPVIPCVSCAPPSLCVPVTWAWSSSRSPSTHQMHPNSRLLLVRRRTRSSSLHDVASIILFWRMSWCQPVQTFYWTSAATVANLHRMYE